MCNVRLKSTADNMERFQFKNKLQEAIYMFLITALVDRNEYADLIELFDKDKSGKILLEEFQEVVQYNNDVMLDNWKAMIKEVDLNGDGEIDFDEFKVLLMKLVRKDIKIQKHE